MIINMWSGPRNISTAIMRSFENRKDTLVIDEPFYAYYLKKTNLKHPMYKEIISSYENDPKKIIKEILKKNDNKLIFIKHMSHHIDNDINLEWILKTRNFFLIRDPKKVINSYIKNNKLYSINDLGLLELYNIFKFLKSIKNNNPIIINTNKLLANPKKILMKLCRKLDIQFDNSMLSWKKGKRSSDGIWSDIWYKNVINSTKFDKEINNEINIPNKYNEILDQCLEIYSNLNKYTIS